MGSNLKEKLGEKNLAMVMALFLAGALLIILYMVLNNFTQVRDALSTVVGVLMPLIFGVVIAYLLSPVFDLITRAVYANLKGKLEGHEKWELRISKAVATVLSITLLLLALAAFGVLVIPMIVTSVSQLIEIVPESINGLVEWVKEMDTREGGFIESGINWLENSTDNIITWMRESLLPGLGDLASHVYAGVWGTVKTFLNLLVGIITSAYLLNGREHFKAVIKKAIYAYFPESKANGIIEFSRYTNKMFGGFISGKIVDSIIIGFMCFGLMLILGLPYAVLVSCIIGITNIIPFFGPFIGAVPGFFIILVVDPVKALVFAVMILALQQFDGNILGPKILGNTTGLESFWVLFAIIVGGGLFGFVGMVLAVPTFAVCYYYFSKKVEAKLEKKGMPSDTSYYENTDIYDPEKHKKELEARAKERRKKSKKAKEADAKAGKKDTEKAEKTAKKGGKKAGGKEKK